MRYYNTETLFEFHSFNLSGSLALSLIVLDTEAESNESSESTENIERSTVVSGSVYSWSEDLFLLQSMQ